MKNRVNKIYLDDKMNRYKNLVKQKTRKKKKNITQ